MEEKETKNKYLKLLIIIAVIVVLAVSGFFIYKAVKKEEKKITPLLYKVTKEGSTNEMYLFGSIHFAVDEDLIFPSYVTEAFEKSHYVACELDNANVDTIDMLERMQYQDGTTIKNHLKRETYEKLVSFLTAKSAYNSLYDQYNPAFMISLLSGLSAEEAVITDGDGVDATILKLAKEKNKEILEVETLQFQIDVLANMSDELYDIMINETIDSYQETIKLQKELYEAWKKGDADKIISIINEEDIGIDDNYSDKLKAEIDMYNKRIIDYRNEDMGVKAIEYFNSDKDVFFMVGALHIIGDKGLITTLKNNGFTVTQVN